MHWIIFAAIFGLGQAAHAIFVKFAGNTISPVLAMVITNSVSLAGAVIIFLLFKMTGREIVVDPTGAWWMAAAGASIIVFELAFLWMFFTGAPLAAASTAARVFGILFVVVIGVLVLKEAITVQKIFGICMALASVYFLTK